MLRTPTSFVWPLALIVSASLPAQSAAGAPGVKEIIQRSVAANQANFKAAPTFVHKQRDRSASGSKTYQDLMIDGSPYHRLILVNGEPLSPSQEAEEQTKQEHAVSERRAESAGDRQKRIAKYQNDRKRNHEMMEQLTKAFDFNLVGESKLAGFDVWDLKATPRPGYHPPNMETQVLPGMQGELWIDRKTYQWVKVTARVIHPVSIEGFLAQVEPGTEFELEYQPVRDGIWLPSHFSMKSQAKVLFLINRSGQTDQTFFDFQPVASCCRH